MMTNDDQISNPDAGPGPVAFDLAVFGRDEGGKPHASRFAATDADLAERAAGLMGMQVLRLETSEHRDLGAKLPAGRVFGSGRAFVPFVKGALFEQLAVTPGAFSPERPAEADVPPKALRKAKGGRSAAGPSDDTPNAETPAGGPATPPTDWGTIAVGHRVLAAEESAPEVWYLAIVVASKGEDLLKLRWLGEWSAEPPFVRHRDHLALLPSAVAASLP